MRRHRGGKVNGTPTVNPPEPQALDPASGFKVPLSDLVRQWDGQLVDYRFVDKRNPQDFVRGVKDNQSLPYARPEAPDTFVAQNIIWEAGYLIPINILAQDGGDLLTEGSSLPLTAESADVNRNTNEPPIVMTAQNGIALLTQGINPAATL